MTKRVRNGQSSTTLPQRNTHGHKRVLRRFMEVPLAVFIMIARHVTPSDLIALSRSVKHFRKIIFHRLAAKVWQEAERNVPGLQPCPTRMCELRYATVLFFRNCTLCGAYAQAKPDLDLRVRLCPSCSDTE
ncbi:hypothetical protein BDV93DRAFT_612250 [Ceratobasidium sp. AG-I]|nr:hypothetical protein BDV93DRAFT_612250 [Ceratobasidium sp. AG-I]